eukprot:6201702-Pleurochrysis_carterae.AAC.1
MGLCTLLSEPAEDAGSFMVMVHEDRMLKQLTRGHFQLHKSCESSRVRTAEGAAPASASAPANDAVHGTGNNATDKQPDPTAKPEEDASEGITPLDDKKDSVDETARVDQNNEEENSKPEDNNAAGDGNKEPGATDASKPNDPAPNGEDEKNDSPIFELVVAAMAKQCKEYNLEPAGLELTFFKTLVSEQKHIQDIEPCALLIHICMRRRPAQASAT